MFEQPSSTTSAASNSYFDLGAPSTPATPTAHQTSVIVPPRHHRDHIQNPLTPGNPYYPTNGYGFPLFLGTDFLQFPQSDVTSPLTPNISSPLTPNPFGPFPGIPANQLYNRSTFQDFYTATSSSPMVQYSAVKKSSAGRKPKEEDNMDDDDDDKKLKRRQRNKEAAARCRQRRLDLMKELQDQVNGYKNLNDKKTAECNEIRSKLASLKNFLEQHDCKLSTEERMRHLTMLTIPAAPARPVARVYSPRPDSVPPSNHSSSSSEQHSPVDYKPPIDQFLPPIGSIKDHMANQMPPPSRVPAISAYDIRLNAPVAHRPEMQHNHFNHVSINQRTENIFAEPELKIPKLEDARDRDITLTSAALNIDRPSALPMPTIQLNAANQPITTPSQPFRNNTGSFMGNDNVVDFLACSTGLTPSGNPGFAFVSTPTPIVPLPDADLRPL